MVSLRSTWGSDAGYTATVLPLPYFSLAGNHQRFRVLSRHNMTGGARGCGEFIREIIRISSLDFLSAYLSLFNSFISRHEASPGMLVMLGCAAKGTNQAGVLGR